MAASFFREKKIPLIHQKVALLANYPDSKCEIKREKSLIWSGKIRPTAISKEYSILICWKTGMAPHIWAFGDELERLDDPDFPHKYDINADSKMVRLCLYRYQEFSSYKFMAKTIIPWTVEWLYHYEIWLATGEWCGGGEHPSSSNVKVEDPLDCMISI